LTIIALFPFRAKMIAATSMAVKQKKRIPCFSGGIGHHGDRLHYSIPAEMAWIAGGNLVPDI
jgi:hypothetical protein